MVSPALTSVNAAAVESAAVAAELEPVERAESLTGAWDGEWFAEDYCEGPGQALIVNPRGDVKPCCGFASDLDQLTIGNIYHDKVAAVVRR